MADQTASDFDVAKLKNVNRVTSFPLIRQTLDFSFAAYTRVKTLNSTVNTVLTKVEEISTGAIGNFKPVVERFDKQIVQADVVLGQVLDQLEHYVPAVKTISPLNVYQYGLNKATDLRTAAFQQVQNAKEFGIEKATTVGQFQIVKASFQAVDAIVESIDSAVDTYLPAGDDEETDSDSEGPNKQDKNANTLDKITKLTSKLRTRLTKFTVDKLHYVQRLYF